MWEAVVKEFETKMLKAVEVTAHEFATVRTGRASSTLVESLKVIYYGTPTPMKQVANITVPEPRLIVIQPWDASAIKDIEKAILTSDLGLQPIVDGKMVRVPIPPLTKERREELVKVVKKMSEDGKVVVRNLRRDANEAIKKLEKDKKVDEDDSKRAQEDIQKKTDGFTKRLEELATSKEKELLTV